MQHQRFSGLGRRLRTLTGVAFTLVVSAYSGVGCSDAQSGGGTGGAGGANGCNVAVLCDGQNVATLDTCTQVKQVLTTCPKSCHQGDCVDCVPGAGQICVGNDVYQIDSCGTQGALKESCPNGCSSGSCIDAGCTPNAAKTCVGDTVFSVDSCGNRQNAEQICKNGCENGACKACTPNAFTACFGGDIYSLDSCEGLGPIAQDCPDTCEFSGGTVKCVTNTTCSKNSSLTCFLGDIHWVDSCGGIQPDISEDCPSGCDTSGCLPCVPTPAGKTCVGKAVHELLGGCTGTAPAPGNKLEDCANGCQNGACLPPGCVPDVGRICVASAVHNVDSCGKAGTLIESCQAGCTKGACNPVGTGGGGTGGAGTGGTGGAGTGGGGGVETCTCTGKEGGPPLSCITGTTSTNCTGCLLSGDCSTAQLNLCKASCLSKFSCGDGGLIINGGDWLGNCYGCPSSNPSQCYSNTLCGLANCLSPN